MSALHPVIAQLTADITKRSARTRTQYLTRMAAHYGKKINRADLGCTNLAHALAGENPASKILLKQINSPNIAIVSAYNDMLSAHHPYYRYPEQLKTTILELGATAQVAGGVPAMCDGITQAQVGMELSLLSRDIIAMSTAIALSHNVFDGILCLGICDKIVPGLLIGALSYGYLPTIFVPSGPMSSGIANKEKAEIRKFYTEGKIEKKALLDSEMAAYHSAGTCTFYGTANSNQMLMEIMGLHIPGAAFVQPDSELRIKLNATAAAQIIAISAYQNNKFTPLCELINEKTIINAMVGLIATGGSTNHTLHLPAIAKACGIIINWDDFAKISQVVPLLAKVYPNGDADVNQFHQAGGVAYVISQLLSGGLLHQQVNTVVGSDLAAYTFNPQLTTTGQLIWERAHNRDHKILAELNIPFYHSGGLKLVQGNIGRGVTKVSAIHQNHYTIQAPAKIFNNQDEVLKAYHAGRLNQDVVVVLKYQGPRANGMPELHGLSSCLASLQDQGFKVALVTDGRMSGASGKVPHAIHITPEALDNGNIAKIQDGDIINLDLVNGNLELLITAQELAARTIIHPDLSANSIGFGRELFVNLRNNVSSSETGATFF